MDRSATYFTSHAQTLPIAPEGVNASAHPRPGLRGPRDPALGTESSQGPDIEASVHGLILMNAFHTSAKVNNVDVPQFVLPPDPADPPDQSASGGTVRQSRVTATALVP